MDKQIQLALIIGQVVSEWIVKITQTKVETFMAKTGLSHEEVRDIAELAKLDLSDEEVALYSQQLSQILDAFRSLQEVDTSHIAASDSVLPLRNVMRQDEQSAALSTEDVTRNAPSAEDQQFKVSAVLGDE
jgi:aspartyl-tRNA(Asn)/glutamyl-tRNA(Gln) amidotransferase subunit C